MLCNNDQHIRAFPGYEGLFACFDEKEIHTVHQTSHSPYTRNSGKCRTYIYFDKLLCHRTLAVTEQSGNLPEYICHTNERNGNREVNMLKQQQCVGAGKKKNATNRIGPNNQVTQEITQVVPRATLSATEPSTTRPSATQSIQDSKQPFSVCHKIGLIKKCYGCLKKFSKQMDKH